MTQSPSTEFWKVFNSSRNLREVDIALMSVMGATTVFRGFGLPALSFPHLASLRLTGQMRFNLAAAVLNSFDPSRLVNLRLNNIQEIGQMRGGHDYAGYCLAWDEEEIDYPDGRRGLRVLGPMRDLLLNLTGRCTALRSLVLQRVAQEFDVDPDWNENADNLLYKEWAAFIDSVSPTIEVLVFEQGIPYDPLPSSSHRCRGPMETRFRMFILPVLISKPWPRLKTMEIRGLGCEPCCLGFIDELRSSIRSAVGDHVILIIDEPSRTFEHVAKRKAYHELLTLGLHPTHSLYWKIRD